MQLRATIVQAGLALAFLLPAAAQATDAPPPIPGGYNPQTKVFTPDAQPPSFPAAPGSPIHVSGTLKVQATVALHSVPATQTVQAFVTASVRDQRFSNGLGTHVTVTRSGNTGTVNLTFRYIFTVLNTSETVTVSLNLATQQPPAFPFTMVSTTIPLPANGATTVVKLPSAI